MSSPCDQNSINKFKVNFENIPVVIIAVVLMVDMEVEEEIELEHEEQEDVEGST